VNAADRGSRWLSPTPLASGSRLVPYALPAIVWLALTLPTIAQGDYAADSAWYSAIGLQAWRTGDLWTLMGPPDQPYFNKPPLVFWIHGLVLWLAGPSVWAARLPTVFAGVVCVLLTVRLARAFLDRQAACASGLVLALTYEFFRRSFEISLDVWQLVFMLAGTTAATAILRQDNDLAVHASPRSRFGPALAAGACFGLALLCKPFVALAGLVLVASWLMVERVPGIVRFISISIGGALLVALPWHASMIWIHGGLEGEFVKHYFGAEVAARAAGEITASALWTKPWWFYLEQLATTGWPWLVLALLGTLDLALGKLRPAARPLARFALIWLLGWLIILSIFPDRRDRYAVVLHPALALLAASWLDSKLTFARFAPRTPRWILATSALISAGLLIATLAGARIHRAQDRQWADSFAILRSEGWPGGPSTPALWAASLAPHRSARLYLEFGRWAKPTRTRWNDLVIDPARDMNPGDLLIYHRRDGWQPGHGEPSIWTSKDLVLRRFTGTWHPTPTHDPGD
jgi:4-amino-4-deoxy-L-arabinose transferase-like glycosyltransferase